MRLTTHYHHTRYEENGSEGKFSLRMPRRKSSVFKPPVLIQFQVTADTRQLTDPFDGFLLGKRYLIHDRDTKFTQAFDALLKDSGVEPILLPPRSPNLNAHCERFVRSIKEEALSQMVILGERALYKYPPAKPEVLRLLAPQRGLTAIAKSKPKTEKTTNGRLPELSNFESPPAEPGVYHD